MGRRAEGKEKTKVWGRRLSPRASICFHFVPASAGRTLWNNGDTDSDESESGSAGKVVKVGSGSASAVALTFPLRSAFWPHCIGMGVTMAVGMRVWGMGIRM